MPPASHQSYFIRIVPYDPSWPELFYREASLLRQTLGDVAARIHHIGSTSVPGLAAKPIIDIILEVTSVEALDERNPFMEKIGYSVRGEFGIPRRRFFAKGGSDRTHHIHAFRTGDPHIRRHLAFRDYLRAHPETAREYAELKKAVARNCNNDNENYCDGKEAYVKRIEAEALAAYDHA